MFYTVIEMIPASLSLSVALLGSHLYDGLAFYMCNKHGDTTVQSSFGLYLSFNSIIQFSLQCSISEKLGISCSQAFGAYNIPLTKKYFSQGLLTSIIFFAFIVTPVYFFAYEILTFVGIAAVNARLIKEYAWKLYFVNMIDTWNDIVFNYCISQGVETSFAKINGIAIAGGLCVMGVLCFYFDLFIDGWIITHAVSSSINFVGYLVIWVTET